MGMSANLLSLGAVDFGIIIDGAVVMVEGMFVMLDQKAKTSVWNDLTNSAKMGLIKNKGAELGKAIFFSKVIIITALLPIFSFQKVEGKMFSPLAYTLGFALLGALITTLTLVPVLINMLLRKNVHEKHNPIWNFSQNMMFGFQYNYKHQKLVLISSALMIILGFYAFKLLGSEFFPELDEGAIWIRAQLPYSASLKKSSEVADQIRGMHYGIPAG